MKLALVVIMMALVGTSVPAQEYAGRYVSGKGDVEFLRLIDRSFDYFHPSPDVPNISMLYFPEWDCLIEGASWHGWWTQNSYGPTYCSLPFLQEPWRTFLQNSQDLWFKYQGDGVRKCIHTGFIGPDGALCDAATDKGAIYVQGDCNWSIHDWGFEFTAAGAVMQSELLLIDRDLDAIRRYLPNLERCCNFIETRRDRENGLFLVGPAANLLAPSYGGIRQADGSFGKGYLAGLSITYLAVLDRMVELEKLAGDEKKAALYEVHRRKTRDSLAQLITPEGYFVKAIEQDGTKHGVLGQEKYGYFEAVANVDAMAFRAADQAQSERIYSTIASEPKLRPYDFIITNYPSLDDMYDNWGSRDHTSLWTYGTWVNGGVWSTVEARAIMAYYRLGKYEDIRKSALHSERLAADYQMDAPLKDFGNSVWFDNKLTNLCWDALGVPAATVRGLFEYIYKADSLVLYPHIPPSITEYSQKAPIRFGEKRITISVKNGGPKIESVKVNGIALKVDALDSITLPYSILPKNARIEIVTEGGRPMGRWGEEERGRTVEPAKEVPLPESLLKPFDVLTSMQKRLRRQSDADYEKAYLAEALRAFDACRTRASMDMPQFKPEKRVAILKMYEDAALGLYKGLDGLMKRYSTGDEREKQIAGQYALSNGSDK